MIEFTIKTLDCNNHQFSVEDGITVAELKRKVYEMLKIEIHLQRLIFCGRVLQDDKKLSEYNVHGKVVHLVQRAPPSPESRHSVHSSNGNDAAAHARRAQRFFALGGMSADEPRSMSMLPTTGRLEFIKRTLIEIRSTLDTLRTHIALDPISPNIEGVDLNEPEPAATAEENDRMDESSEDNPEATASSRPHAVRRRNRVMRTRPSRPRDLADLMEELDSLQDQFAPYRNHYIRMLRTANNLDPPRYSDENRIHAQRMAEMVADIMHSIAHAYHAISDIEFHLDQRSARILSESPMTRHPIPMQAHINVIRQQATGGAPENNGTATAQNAAPPSETQTNQATAQAGRTTQPTVNIQPDPIAYQVEIETRVPIAFALDNALFNGLRNGDNQTPTEIQATDQTPNQNQANRRQVLFDFENLFRGLSQPGGLGGVEVVMSMEEIPQAGMLGNLVANAAANATNITNATFNTTATATSGTTATSTATSNGAGAQSNSAQNDTTSQNGAAAQNAGQNGTTSQTTSTTQTGPIGPSGGTAGPSGPTFFHSGPHEGVYIAPMSWAGPPSADLLQNIVSSVIRQGLVPGVEGVLHAHPQGQVPQSQTQSANQNSTQNAQGAQGTQGAQEQSGDGADTRPNIHLRRAPTTTRAHPLSLASIVYDRFLPCDNAHARRRLLRRREQQQQQLAAQERMRATRLAMQSIDYLRERCTNLTQDHIQTMAQLLNNPPTRESWITGVMITVARQLFMPDMARPIIGDIGNIPNEYPNIRRMFHNSTENYLNTEGLEDVSRACEAAAEFIMDEYANFINRIHDITPIRPDVDIIDTVRSLLRIRMPMIFTSVMTDAPENSFPIHFYAAFTRLFTEMCGVISYCCKYGVDGLRVLYRAFLEEVVQNFDEPVQQMMMVLGMHNLDSAITHLDEFDDILYFIIRRRPPVVATTPLPPIPQTPSPMDMSPQSSPPKTEPMWTSPPATPYHFCRRFERSNSTDNMESTSSVCVEASTSSARAASPLSLESSPQNSGSPTPSKPEKKDSNASSPASSPTRIITPLIIVENWGEVWMPVFSRDQQMQNDRSPSPEEPYSDAYLSGMPSRKRRRLMQSRPPTTLSALAEESLTEAFHRVPPADERIRNAFREYMRNIVRTRTLNSEDYERTQFPSTEAFLNNARANDQEGPSENDGNS